MFNIRAIIFFVLLINTVIKNQNEASGDSCEKINPSDKLECIDATTEDDKDLDRKCCYRIDTKKDGTKQFSCKLLNDDEYNYIEGYEEEELQDNINLQLIEVDCLQTFINIKMIICLICLFLSYY